MIRAFVKRARRVKGTSAAATQLLGYSNLTLFKNRDTYSVDEADAVDIFFELRGDIERLSLAQYFCELAFNFAVNGANNNEFLRLILNSLHFLTVEKRYPPLIKAITELRIAAISGYAPDDSGRHMLHNICASPNHVHFRGLSQRLHRTGG